MKIASSGDAGLLIRVRISAQASQIDMGGQMRLVKMSSRHSRGWQAGAGDIASVCTFGGLNGGVILSFYLFVNLFNVLLTGHCAVGIGVVSASVLSKIVGAREGFIA